MKEIHPNDIIQGPFWPEKVRIISCKSIGDDRIKIEGVGTDTRSYYDPIVSPNDLDAVTIIEDKSFRFSGDGESLFLYLESHRIRNAFQFDPLYAVNVSQIDPLPHQIDAVYYHIMANPRIRFMLADDPGAGKTIMAGLLIKELKYRGLVDRILIVAPGNLKDQWQRELKDKFQETFTKVDRNFVNVSWGRNVFADYNQVIASMDFCKQDDVLFALQDTRWDLCIVDEAHKMAAYKYGQKISRTQRYTLGELISPITNYLLFLTATPHRGDPENFRLLLDLLEPGFFANIEMLSESIESRDNPLFIRRLKEDMKNFDQTPLFPPRHVETIKYNLSDDEKKLYNAVTEYVEKHFNKALEQEKRNVAFALTILQRRLASSVRAIRKSLERRHKRLQELYEKGQILQEFGFDEDYFEDLEESERWKMEEDLLEKLTSAATLEELKIEIEKLDELVAMAREVEKKEIERKLDELKKLMDDRNLLKSGIKFLIFTESRDTLEYLVEKLRKWGYPVTCIHGGLSLDQKIIAENEFWNNAQIMVSTEAGGEGINLQVCWLMVNYDIPWNPNRLEQRMGRIHRYGQQHEVHIYNLVAYDTREGRILYKLFEKLIEIRGTLGSDRVFDVIGEVLIGKSLKDLILEAISNKRTLDEIIADIDRIPDEEAIRRAKEASLVSLATHHIDLTRILGEQRQAKEQKLVPEYIQKFFERSAAVFGIKYEKTEEAFFAVNKIPLELRQRPHSFKIKYGEVQREYRKIAFDKQIARKGQAEFVSMGHPLLESIIDVIHSSLADGSSEGAVFADRDGMMDGIIWFFEIEIKDGRNDIAGKRLFSVYQSRRTEDAAFRFINPATLWDLKPLKSNAPAALGNLPLMDLNLDSVKSFVITKGIEKYKSELYERRKRDADLKEKYGIRSLDSMLLDSQAKLSEYETRRMQGINIPDVTIQNETRKKEDLERKKDRLAKEIYSSIHLTPSDPKIIGAIRVIPAEEGSVRRSDKETERIAMEIAVKYEKEEGRFPDDIHAENLGYDVRSGDSKGNYRYIEVKGRSDEGAVELTPNEWLMANRLGDEYYLYVVANAKTTPALFIMHNPASCLKPEEKIDIVRYIVKDWKSNSRRAE